MKRGDKVVARGPIVNEVWDPAWQATIRKAYDDGTIDVQWDRGGINYRCYPEGFMVVADGEAS